MYQCLVHHLRNDVPVAKNIYFFYTKKQVCFHIFAKLLSRSYRKNTILYYLWFIIIVYYYHLLKEFYFMKLNEIEITDFNAPELDIYSRCNEAQLLHYFEPAPGIFIAESPKVIERALHAGYAPISFLAEKRLATADAGETRQLLEKYPDVPVFTAEYNVLTKLTGFALTRGMLCAMKRIVLPSVEEICKNASRIAILENVVNPTNVGAIIRSAAALGMDAVLLTHGCSDPLYRRASRVSMGTVFQIPWTILPKDSWPCATLDTLKNMGFKTAAMALKTDSVSIDDTVLASYEKLAIVLGTEGEGLKNATIAACDYTVLIPMFHGVDSLNVAAASAVAFWQLGRRK